MVSALSASLSPSNHNGKTSSGWQPFKCCKDKCPSSPLQFPVMVPEVICFIENASGQLQFGSDLTEKWYWTWEEFYPRETRTRVIRITCEPSRASKLGMPGIWTSVQLPIDSAHHPGLGMTHQIRVVGPFFLIFKQNFAYLKTIRRQHRNI